MKCPFELPVKTNISPVDPDLRYVSSKEGYIFGDCHTKYADYIVAVINSHENLVKAIKDTCQMINDNGKVNKWKIQNWLEQALEEVEKPK